jgi:hypothetical protein
VKQVEQTIIRADRWIGEYVQGYLISETMISIFPLLLGILSYGLIPLKIYFKNFKHSACLHRSEMGYF